MTTRRIIPPAPRLIAFAAFASLAALAGACRADAGSAAQADSTAAAADSSGGGSQPPVVLNAVSPAEYPAALLRRRIGGTVTLALWIDSAGQVVPESTQVAESSGRPALDSAALRAAPALRFAPALEQGRPVAAAVLQPVEFSPQRASEHD